MALGAKPTLLLGTVIHQGMLPVTLGVMGGTGVALLASKALSSFLFEIEPTDPVSVLVAAGTLLTAGGSQRSCQHCARARPIPQKR